MTGLMITGLKNTGGSMARMSAEKVKSKLDTHEAVCAERWLETITRIKRLEAIFIAFSGATMIMLVTIIIKQL
jgi:hypothetical protein